MPIRRPLVRRHSAFEKQVCELRDGGYEQIEAAVDDFCNELALAQTESPATLVRRISSTTAIYAHRFDYEPFGVRGRGRLRVTYSYKASENEMRAADEIVMLSIGISAEHLN